MKHAVKLTFVSTWTGIYPEFGASNDVKPELSPPGCC
jgi:hypothetical protein